MFEILLRDLYQRKISATSLDLPIALAGSRAIDLSIVSRDGDIVYYKYSCVNFNVNHCFFIIRFKYSYYRSKNLFTKIAIKIIY